MSKEFDEFMNGIGKEDEPKTKNMSKEDKYYQPEIEEFHVGFEYEAKDPIAKEWVEFEVNLEFSSLWFASANKTRVKLLDREDVESLGFITIEKDPQEYGGITYWREDFILNHEGGLITLRDSKGDGTLFRFSGSIKNKSELKRLLKQIGV